MAKAKTTVPTSREDEATTTTRKTAGNRGRELASTSPKLRGRDGEGQEPELGGLPRGEEGLDITDEDEALLLELALRRGAAARARTSGADSDSGGS